MRPHDDELGLVQLAGRHLSINIVKVFGGKIGKDIVLVHQVWDGWLEGGRLKFGRKISKEFPEQAGVFGDRRGKNQTCATAGQYPFGRLAVFGPNFCGDERGVDDYHVERLEKGRIQVQRIVKIVEYEAPVFLPLSVVLVSE